MLVRDLKSPCLGRANTAEENGLHHRQNGLRHNNTFKAVRSLSSLHYATLCHVVGSLTVVVVFTLHD